MTINDYNGTGEWSRARILERYAGHAKRLGQKSLRDLTPCETTQSDRRWIYPMMYEVIAGIEASDAACIAIGVELVESEDKFAFGKLIKSKNARALQRAAKRGELTESQCHRIKQRVFAMLEAGIVPHEFREYAQLTRQIGFSRRELPLRFGTSARMKKFFNYFELKASM